MRRHELAAARLGRLPSVAVSRFVRVVEAVAFWGAVLAPLGYLPVVALDRSTPTIAALLIVHAACLIVGHRYRPPADGGLLAMLASVSREGKH